MIVLDTHALVWWIGRPNALSSAARKSIEEAAARSAIYASAISCWEIALLVARKRLDLAIEVADWVARCEGLPYLHFVPLDNRIALKSVALPPPFHEDPADRMIIATALSLGAKLVTKDRRMHGYTGVETIW